MRATTPDPSTQAEQLISPNEKTAGPQKKRRRAPWGKLFFLLILLAAIGMFVWVEYQRRETREQLQQTQSELQQLKASTERSGQEMADEVLQEVRQHYRISDGDQPVVATIVDVEALRRDNEFYNLAENGDHIIVTTDPPRAILYSVGKKMVLDVVPVTEEEAETEQQVTDQPSPTP